MNFPDRILYPLSKKRSFRGLCLLKASLLFFTGAFAQGNLQIYPKRIVFDGTKRSQELSLANNGKDTARYIISVVQIRMGADGSFETISQPDIGQKFADKNFRFFPRSVTLAPNESQTIKIQLYKYSDLPQGEYRSHLYFRAEPDKAPLGEGGKDVSIAIHLVPVFGISIPVIIRAGESTTDIKLSHLSFELKKDTIPVLYLDLNRNGNMSVYGDFTVDYLSPEGKEIRVAYVKGVALYTPNNTRHFQLPLAREADVDYHRGSLHVVFKDESGKIVKLAQEQIPL